MACAAATPSNPHGRPTTEVDDRQDERVGRPPHLQIGTSMRQQHGTGRVTGDMSPRGKREQHRHDRGSIPRRTEEQTAEIGREHARNNHRRPENRQLETERRQVVVARLVAVALQHGKSRQQELVGHVQEIAKRHSNQRARQSIETERCRAKIPSDQEAIALKRQIVEHLRCRTPTG